jgi:cellulose synthase/poly-beta-1,6-N-acetylglucosamine synthase-like glycosyltransferase
MIPREIKVSIIIPAFGTAKYIRETLESVFVQTFESFEAIVINDGSPDTDELEQVLAPYQGRIVYFKQVNRGLAGARNTGIRHARGEYLAFLDSDDCWLPDYLASQLKLFEATPSLDVVYSDAQRFGDPATAGKTCMQTSPSNGPVTLDSLIRLDCVVVASCTMARRQVVVDAGLFDESFRQCEDYDLWLRILYRGGQIGYQKKVLGRYRTRPGSLSRNAIKMSEALLAVNKKAATTMTLPERTRALLQQQIARAQAHIDLEAGKMFLASGDFDRAKESFSKANHSYRSARLKLAILGLQFVPRWTRLAVLGRQNLTSSRE